MRVEWTVHLFSPLHSSCQLRMFGSITGHLTVLAAFFYCRRDLAVSNIGFCLHHFTIAQQSMTNSILHNIVYKAKLELLIIIGITHAENRFW